MDAFFGSVGGVTAEEPARLVLVGMFVCALIATGMSAYGQYYVTIMPFWAARCIRYPRFGFAV